MSVAHRCGPLAAGPAIGAQQAGLTGSFSATRSVLRTTLVGRIQPFRPGGTFEAFGRTARDIGQSTPFCPKPGASSCSQSLTLPPGAPGSAACQGFLAVRLKPAPLLGSSVDPVFSWTASFPWLSVHRKLAHKVSLCFSTPRRCWVWGVCRPSPGRSSPQAAHKTVGARLKLPSGAR